MIESGKVTEDVSSWNRSGAYLISCQELNKCCMTHLALLLLGVRVQLLCPLCTGPQADNLNQNFGSRLTQSEWYLEESTSDVYLGSARLNPESVIVRFAAGRGDKPLPLRPCSLQKVKSCLGQPEP